MKRMSTMLGFAMACSAATVMAQSYPEKSQADKDKMAKDVMVTGCVAKADAGDGFTLTNAMMSDAMMSKDKTSSDPMKKTGTTGTTWSYELVGGENLSAHLGHKVEVTGTTDKTKKMDTMSDQGKMDKDKMDRDKMSGMSHDTKAGKLTVKSVKMLSATCP